MEEEKPKGSFDRGLNFEEIKDRLLTKTNILFKRLQKIAKPQLALKQLSYCIIALIQLRNGSRISEAIKAFKYFITNGIKKEAQIKISKSDATKIVKKDGKKRKIKLQARFRSIIFPNKWISPKIFKCVRESDLEEWISSSRMRKRVLDYLLNHFNANTHSLRYAFINHMLYEKKVEMGLVSKIVGHANMDMLVTYTQKKNADDKLKNIEI